MLRKNIWPFFIITALIIMGWANGRQPAYAGSETTVSGSGKVATQVWKIASIHRVSVNSVGLLTIDVGKKESLTIEAEENLLPLIQVKRDSDGTLEIGPKPNTHLLPSKLIRYRLSVKSLDGIILSGITTGSVNAIVTKQNVTIDLSGAASLSIGRLVANNLSVTASGSCHARINEGQVHQLTLDLSGASNYLAYGVTSPAVSATVSGSSRVEVTVTHHLDVSGSGAAQVHYRGHPTEGNREMSGISRVYEEN